MTRNGVYIEHRYGQHNGQIKVQSKQGVSHRSTESAMFDKCRYNETRFSGEANTIFGEDGAAILGGYREAYQQTAKGADGLAADNLKGRNKGKAYIYDTTINPGAGRLSNQAAHQVAQDFRAELVARGYKVAGFQYAIHQGTEHTHIHAMYATHKTLQLKEIRPMQAKMRDYVEREQAQDKAREQVQAREQVHEQGHERARGG